MIVPATLLALAALLNGAISFYAARHRAFAGRTEFAVAHAAACWWASAAAIECFSTGVQAKMLWAEMAWPGIVLAPTYWTLFLWSYFYANFYANLKPVPLYWHYPLIGGAIVIWILALTNDFHHLMYLGAEPFRPDPGAGLRYEHGPLCWAVAGYIYVVMFASSVMIVNSVVYTCSYLRIMYLTLLVVPFVNLGLGIGYLTGRLFLFEFDPNPFGFFVDGFIMLWLIKRRNIFELLPIARTVLLNAMPDAALVLDSRDVIIEANASAHRLVGMPLNPVGQRLEEIPIWEQLLRPEFTSCEKITEGIITEPTQHSYYEVKSIPLKYNAEYGGRLTFLRDITQLKLARDQLQGTLEALQGQLAHTRTSLDALREQTIRDPLTGVYNRRFLEDARPLLLAEARLAGEPLALIMVDFDHFKRVNDTWGHQVGDAVLQAFAVQLLNSARRADFTIRLGGEEFLVVLPGTLAEQARARVDAWREGFIATCARKWPGRPLTFSGGVAAYPQDGIEWDLLLQRADAALYDAKAQGRNRIRCWSDLPVSQAGADALPPSLSLISVMK